MIFNTDLNARRNAGYESAIKNLEKAQQILDDRFAKKQISNEDYIKKSKDITKQIEDCKRMIGQN